jgi:hypothetical protein
MEVSTSSMAFLLADPTFDSLIDPPFAYPRANDAD